MSPTMLNKSLLTCYLHPLRRVTIFTMYSYVCHIVDGVSDGCARLPLSHVEYSYLIRVKDDGSISALLEIISIWLDIIQIFPLSRTLA